MILIIKFNSENLYIKVIRKGMKEILYISFFVILVVYVLVFINIIFFK